MSPICLQYRLALFEGRRSGLCTDWLAVGLAFQMLTLSYCADASVAVDVLTMLQHKTQSLKLEHCPSLVQCLELLLVAPHKKYTQLGVSIALTLLKIFGDVIQHTCQQSTGGVGVDVTYEERKDRCETARKCFKRLSITLEQLASTSDDAILAQLQQRLMTL